MEETTSIEIDTRENEVFNEFLTDGTDETDKEASSASVPEDDLPRETEEAPDEPATEVVIAAGQAPPVYDSKCKTCGSYVHPRDLDPNLLKKAREGRMRRNQRTSRSLGFLGGSSGPPRK